MYAVAVTILFKEGKFEELKDFANANISKDPETGRWLCSICGATFVNKLDVKRHIEAKHVVLPPLYCNRASMSKLWQTFKIKAQFAHSHEISP